MLFDFLRKKDNIKAPIDPASLPAHTGHDGMTVEDVFTIKGRGTIVTGVCEGTIIIGDTVIVHGAKEGGIKSEVAGVEVFRKSLDFAEDGMNCGLLLKGVNREDVEPGDYVEVVA